VVGLVKGIGREGIGN